MRIVTWNVNSVRSREERLLKWLETHAPDALCLQELKVVDEAFPFDAVGELGYHAVVHGQPTYNGVAILAKSLPTEVVRGFGDGGDDSQSRFIVATVDGVRIACAYVPNGSFVGSQKWAYKRTWYERLDAWLGAHVDPSQPFALCGDFNAAFDDRDIYDPAGWADTVLYHPDVRAWLHGLLERGLHDSLRLVNDEAGIYSWWDYRRLAFPKGKGVRIDHVLVSDALKDQVEAVWVDRDERKGKKPDVPSDHAPVVCDLKR